MAEPKDRIESLANQLWPGRGARLDLRAGVDLVDSAGGLLFGIAKHPHALEAAVIALEIMHVRMLQDRAIRLTAELEVAAGRAELCQGER